MNEVLLFTDGSVNNNTKSGYGAYLYICDHDFTLEALKQKIITVPFENTSSTKLELQILLWALTKNNFHNKKIIIYTDSRNIIGLSGRRGRLEKQEYHSKNNKPIINAELYKQFYQVTDRLNCEIVKIQGHQRSSEKDEIAKIFTLVDRAARKAVRENNK